MLLSSQMDIEQLRRRFGPAVALFGEILAVRLASRNLPILTHNMAVAAGEEALSMMVDGLEASGATARQLDEAVAQTIAQGMTH